MEVRNLRNTTIAQTSLLGEDDTPTSSPRMAVLSLRVSILGIKSLLIRIP